MASATMTTRGRVTIPKEVRDRLGIGPGDKIEFVARDGKVEINRAQTSARKQIEPRA